MRNFILDEDYVLAYERLKQLDVIYIINQKFSHFTESLRLKLRDKIKLTIIMENLNNHLKLI